MAEARIVFPATIVVDLTIAVPAVPAAGGDALASSGSMSAGGGFNAIAAAARDGASVVFAGRYGDGPFGAVVGEALRREGVAAVHPPLTGVDSGYCVVLVDAEAERTNVTVPGAEARLTRADLAAVPVTGADIVYISGYALAAPGSPLGAWVETLPEATRVVFDPSPLVGSLDADALARVLGRADVVSANAREAAILTGGGDPAQAAEMLLRRLRPGGLAVVRGGAAGCWVAMAGGGAGRATAGGAASGGAGGAASGGAGGAVGGDGAHDGAAIHLPAFAVTAVDTTGAGDAHGGVLAAALLRGEPPLAAARRANAAAAIAVTRSGPATAPTSAETDRLLREGREAQAPADRDAPVPAPAVTRAVLQDVRLPAPRSIGRIQTRRITIPPGVAGGLHVHNGPVVGSVERGSAVYQVEGEAAQALRPGDVFYEEEGARIARFDAGPEGVVFLGHFPVGAEEEPSLSMLEDGEGRER